MSIQILCSFKKIGLFSLLSSKNFFFYILDKSLISFIICKYYLTLCELSFHFPYGILWSTEVFNLKKYNLSMILYYYINHSQSYGFASSHVWMWELDYQERWAPKNWWFWTVVLEKTLESSLDCKEIQPVHPKGNQSWVLSEGLMLKLKLQYFGQLIQRTESLEKTLMLGKIEGRRRKRRQRMR